MNQRWSIAATAVAGLIVGSAMLAGQDTPKPAARAARPATADEQAIRDLLARFAEAFNKGDADAIAAQFTEDARVVDEEGEVAEGRDAIRARFAESFAENPDLRVDFQVDRLDFLTPDVALEEGHGTARESAEGVPPETSYYTAIYVKRDGKWLISRVRDHADPLRELDTPRSHLDELAWMVGDWVEESDEAVVRTECAWADDGNYLLRTFTVHVAGKPALTGSQRIAWDPQRRQFRSWVFDSDGGFSEGSWTQAGEDQWIIRNTGVLRDGSPVTAVNIITREGPETMRWQSTERTMGGVALGDDVEIVVARKPPGPESAPAEAAPKAAGDSGGSPNTRSR
jgi:uncharacterized protein (TIGR02246 family)